MNKVKLFVDETVAILNEKGWTDIDVSWLVEDELQSVFGIDKLIGSFVRVHNLGELPKEKVAENFATFKDFINSIKNEKFKEILEMRYDPRLYMDDKELIDVLCVRLEDRLHKDEKAVEAENAELVNFMNMFGALAKGQQRLHQYAKRKKVKK